VLGGTGMVGHVVSLFLAERGHDVTVFSRRNAEWCNTIIGDATNLVYLRKVVVSGNFDVIVNAIGILNADAERNKSNAVLINSYLPHYLVEITKQTNTRVIHISTDCVFSGIHGRYDEKSFTDGTSFYDRTKAVGEVINQKDLTFRKLNYWTRHQSKWIGLLNWFMKQNGSIFGYKNVLWTGVTSITLAQAIEKAVESNLTGLYNLVNNDTISNRFANAL
jgi:dTDP-4-dehydrorhamnose reductase